MRPLTGGLSMTEANRALERRDRQLVAAVTSPVFDHEPVLLDETLEQLSQAPAGVVVDGTLGGGGHASAVLANAGHLRVLGIDQDPIAIEAATRKLEPHGERATIVRARFDEIARVLDEHDIVEISGFLLDLGVSSPQLDTGSRGFSFRSDAPLDMRMDPDSPRRAHDVVNGYPLGDLRDVLSSWADERNAARIARAIVEARPIETTRGLAEVVESATPARDRRKATVHPATRTFQAIRIEVNQELEILGPTLETLVDSLAIGGVGVVLTYHSGEDRIAKHAFRTAIEAGSLPGLPPVSDFEWAVRGATTPSSAEIDRNPRARSAKLRAIRRHGRGTRNG